MKKSVTWSDVVVFFAGWRFPDYFIYCLTIFVSLVFCYVAGVNL